MSIWSTVHEIRAKKYEHSNVDPRKKAPADEVQTAVVMDYVYDDEAHAYGHAALPYLRLSVGNGDVILTEKGARKLRDALQWFIDFPKTREPTHD